jgi:predicted transglutaminase-like cysteine proteinase
MGILGLSRAWRAVVLACGLVWFGPAADLLAANLTSPAALNVVRGSAEPFGLFTSPVTRGALREKWLGVARRLDDEMVQLALCEGDPDRCAAPAALQFLAIVDNGKSHEGRARLGEINRAINLAIRPMTDFAQWGQIDVWSSPLVTFTQGAGDCEDYAIAKLVALRQAGVSPDDLRIVVVRDTINGEGHAIAAARLDGRWLMLDNRRMTMVEDADERNYRPLFVIDQHGVERYVDTPPADPALVAVNLTAQPVTASSSH